MASITSGRKRWKPIPTVPCRYVSTGRRPDGKYVEYDSVPHLCHIELTYACNARCIFCYNPERAELGDLDLTWRVVKAVAASEIPHVYLIGGEPSVVPVEFLNRSIELLSQHSSVTIVTNGIRRLEGISPKLACFGVPIHGASAATHEFINRANGSFERTLETIRAYVADGFDVRCIPVLTGYNATEIYGICSIAADLGMESVFVDRYEDGGIGAQNSPFHRLKPTADEFRDAVSQMLRACEDFPGLRGRIGFGTAIPYCIDERLIVHSMTADCGVGSTFCAVNPDGEVRLCNQSQLVVGNVLEHALEQIWQQPTLDVFRDLQWVDEPCRSCPLLLDCCAGCKVDANCSDRFCVDYAVRGCQGPSRRLVDLVREPQPTEVVPVGLRAFRPNRYLKLSRHSERFLVTRYQTVKLDELAREMVEEILKGRCTDEAGLIAAFSDKVESDEVRLFVSRLLQVGAIDLTEG